MIIKSCQKAFGARLHWEIFKSRGVCPEHQQDKSPRGVQVETDGADEMMQNVKGGWRVTHNTSTNKLKAERKSYLKKRHQNDNRLIMLVCHFALRWSSWLEQLISPLGDNNSKIISYRVRGVNGRMVQAFICNRIVFLTKPSFPANAMSKNQIFSPCQRRQLGWSNMPPPYNGQLLSIYLL